NNAQSCKSGAELFPLSHMACSLVKGPLCRPYAKGSDAKAGAVEEFHDMIETLALLPEKILSWYPHIVEGHLTGCRATERKLTVPLGRLIAGAFCVHDYSAQAVMLPLCIGIGNG